jgi:hypothetical protein
MPAFVVRLWIPDRPGALGAVASRIGAVRGDLVGIDILERGGGRAIDEIVVELPDADLVPLMLAEISEVDGVDVEHVHPVRGPAVDARLDALETAAMLTDQVDSTSLLSALTGRAAHDFEADWATVLDFEAPQPAIEAPAHGSPPPQEWLKAFVAGSATSEAVTAGESGPDDIAWAGMPVARRALVLGREGRPFRSRERRQLAALARIADARWRDIVISPARAIHPSTARRRS